MQQIEEASDGEQMEVIHQISAKEFAAKFSTKYEVYNFLTVECSAYLPDCKCVTIYWLKDIISKKKKGKFKYLKF